MKIHIIKGLQNLVPSPLIAHWVIILIGSRPSKLTGGTTALGILLLADLDIQSGPAQTALDLELHAIESLLHGSICVEGNSNAIPGLQRGQFLAKEGTHLGAADIIEILACLPFFGACVGNHPHDVNGIAGTEDISPGLELGPTASRSEEHTSELQSPTNL